MAFRRDTKVVKVSQASSTILVEITVTVIALIQAARSAELMLLHSFRTLGDWQLCALAEVNKREETGAMRRMLRKTIVESEAQEKRHGTEQQPSRCWMVFIAQRPDTEQNLGQGLYGGTVQYTRRSNVQNTVTNTILPIEADCKDRHASSGNRGTAWEA